MGGFTETVVIVFELSASKITVIKTIPATLERTTLFSAVPYLTEEGECLLEVDGSFLKLWQVSRKALDDLVFGF
jgi:hypothetical protein